MHFRYSKISSSSPSHVFIFSRYYDIVALVVTLADCRAPPLSKARLTSLDNITTRNATWYHSRVSMKGFTGCLGHGVKKYRRPGNSEAFINGQFMCHITSGMNCADLAATLFNSRLTVLATSLDKVYCKARKENLCLSSLFGRH